MEKIKLERRIWIFLLGISMIALIIEIETNAINAMFNIQYENLTETIFLGLMVVSISCIMSETSLLKKIDKINYNEIRYLERRNLVAKSVLEKRGFTEFIEGLHLYNILKYEKKGEEVKNELLKMSFQGDLKKINESLMISKYDKGLKEKIINFFKESHLPLLSSVEFLNEMMINPIEDFWDIYLEEWEKRKNSENFLVEIGEYYRSLAFCQKEKLYDFLVSIKKDVAKKRFVENKHLDMNLIKI